MTVPQCGRCGGKGGPHTCLRDLPVLPMTDFEGRDLRGPGRDELKTANAKLQAVRQVAIDNKPAPLWRILKIIDGDS